VVIKNLPKANHQIRAQSVKIINPDGHVLGEFNIREAMRMARDQKLDLVEVATNAKPPVCKIMNFVKYIYEKKRQERAARKHHHRTTGREIRMSLKISEHDYQVKLIKVKEFLLDGDRVKVTLRLRGREMLHADLGFKVLDRVTTDLEGLGKKENPTARENNIIHVTFLPEKKRR
jgi:translation initiation factor IF-3